MFTVKLNGGVRLTIGESVIIDNLLDSSAEVVTSDPISLMDDVFYLIKVEYPRNRRGAHPARMGIIFYSKAGCAFLYVLLHPSHWWLNAESICGACCSRRH